MRPSLLLVYATFFLSAQASWFGGSDSPDPPYTSWSKSELQTWLKDHNVKLPSRSPSQSELRDLVASNWNTASAWTYDQYNSAQKAFADVRETSFDKWDESRLRQFLLEQGIVAPKGPREQLVTLAKQRYKDYTNAASSYSSRASSTASTMVFDTGHQMHDSASSIYSQATAAAAQATKDVGRAFDGSKDYIYSTWDDNRMRSYLEDKGVIKTKTQKSRNEMLSLMHDYYAKAANPIWESWSDSYMHDWLVSHNIMKSDSKNRNKLVGQMKKYYYSTSDSVWSTWSDSQLKQWLVEHNVVKSDAKISRDKMIKMVEDHYLTAKDTFWSAWSDNQIRDWLIEHGYMRSNAQVKRDELIKLANAKYTDASSRTAAYLTWPDARLRAYLREHNLNEEMIPGDRPGLLQETRIRWVQTQTRAEAMFQKIRELVNGGVYKAEDVLGRVLSLLIGGWDDTKEKAYHAYHAGEATYDDTKKKAEKAGEDAYAGAKGKSEDSYHGSKEWVEKKAHDAREHLGEKVKSTGQKIKGEL